MAFIAYHFHWSGRELMNLEHAERRVLELRDVGRARRRLEGRLVEPDVVEELFEVAALVAGQGAGRHGERERRAEQQRARGRHGAILCRLRGRGIG